MSDCIEWTGTTTAGGYGVRKLNKKRVYVHRWVVAQIHGWEAIEGKVVMHTCDNPPCINVDHLRIGTQAENVKDMNTKGRRKGDFLPVLNEYAVRWIRSYYATEDYTQRELADQFGVSDTAVNAIIARRSWKHV